MHPRGRPGGAWTQNSDFMDGPAGGGPRGDPGRSPWGRLPGPAAGRLGQKKILVICLSNLLPVALLFTPKGWFF